MRLQANTETMNTKWEADNVTKKIFKSNILVAVVVLIFGIACVMAILYQHFGKQIDTELKKEATYLAYGVEQNGVDYLNQIKEKDDRITYIAEDGTVLYDNQADSSSMENHSDRKEVQEALKSGSGRAERDSKTLSQKTIYYALRLSDNTVLRVSSTQYSVWVLLMEMVPPMIGIAVVMLILAGLVSMHMANKIVEPINNVDLEHPEENQIYEEVGPLLSKIYKQNRQIRSQLEAARRNQEEFTIITENMQEGLLVIDSYTMILSGNSICLVLQKPLLSLIFGSVEPAVMRASETYFFYTALSFPFIAAYDSAASIFRAQDNTKGPMIISMISNVMNIAGNAVMIWVFHMGVAGAALSTLISRIFCAVVVIIQLRKEREGQEIVVRDYFKIRPDWSMIRRILGLGIPSGVENS